MPAAWPRPTRVRFFRAPYFIAALVVAVLLYLIGGSLEAAVGEHLSVYVGLVRSLAIIYALAWLFFTFRAFIRTNLAVIAVTVLVATTLIWRGIHLRAQNRALDLAAGFVSGVLNTSTSMSGPPLVLYLQNRGMTPGQFRATLNAFFLASGAIATFLFVIGDRIGSSELGAAGAAAGAWPWLAAAVTGCAFPRPWSALTMKYTMPATIATGTTKRSNNQRSPARALRSRPPRDNTQPTTHNRPVPISGRSTRLSRRVLTNTSVRLMRICSISSGPVTQATSGRLRP